MSFSREVKRFLTKDHIRFKTETQKEIVGTILEVWSDCVDDSKHNRERPVTSGTGDDGKLEKIFLKSSKERKPRVQISI